MGFATSGSAWGWRRATAERATAERVIGRRVVAWASVVAVGLTLLVAVPSPASAGARLPALELHYDVYYSLFRLITIASRTRVEPDVYSLESTMETVGLIGTLFPWRYRSEVHGRIEGKRLRPDVFHSRSEFRDDVQQVSLLYNAAGPTVQVVNPFDMSVLGDGEERSREEVPPELQLGTIDPLTEIAALTHDLARGEGCSGKRRVFDGLRRYDIVYEDLGVGELEDSSYDDYSGRARVCRSRLEPIAGFWKPKEEKGESLTGITAWLLPPIDGYAPVPVRLQVEGVRGTLQIHLTKAEAPAS